MRIEALERMMIDPVFGQNLLRIGVLERKMIDHVFG